MLVLKWKLWLFPLQRVEVGSLRKTCTTIVVHQQCTSLIGGLIFFNKYTQLKRQFSYLSSRESPTPKLIHQDPSSFISSSHIKFYVLFISFLCTINLPPFNTKWRPNCFLKQPLFRFQIKNKPTTSFLSIQNLDPLPSSPLPGYLLYYQ